MKRFICVLLPLVVLIPQVSLGDSQENSRKIISTRSLFEEMIDLESLTRLPDPSYRTVQFSSFDRRSNLPGGKDWFANSDGFGREPIPNFEKVLKPPGPDGIGEYVAVDIKGPGAVVRLWSAAISGNVRFYIDDLSRPLYEGPAEVFFKRAYDCFPESQALDRSLLEKTVYQRDASYAPLPFRKSLRIVWIGNIQEIHFYQIGIRLYEPGTKIDSFRGGDLTSDAPALNRILGVLADPDGELKPQGTDSTPLKASLPPREKREIFSADGPQAVVNLKLRLTAEDTRLALRETILHVVCDDAPWGQVQSPVGDFFGAAPGINPFVSLPSTVLPDGTMVCRFIMPFKRGLKIILENTGAAPVNASGSVSVRPYEWDERRSMHFRARWRVDHGLTASNTDVQDLPFLVARGQGLYVGTVSYIMNPSPIPTPYGSWWGEGDEKIFVDDDTVPSTFGTGSEDYYNYSWSSPDIFAFPFCGQPRNDGPGNRGFVTNFRWHILDPLPFRDYLAFFMELYSHEKTPGLSYARIGYHYARPGVIDDVRPVSPDDVKERILPVWEPAARMGARNTRFSAAEKCVTDPENTLLRGGRIYAGASALVWVPQKAGETKDFKWSVEKAGKKRIQIAFAQTGSSGAVSILLDGQPVVWPGGTRKLELRAPGRILVRMKALPPADLEAGEHVLTLKFEGADSDISRPEIGVDFIGIQSLDK